MSEEFHSFARVMDAFAVGEFADGDWAVGVDSLLVDPVLDSVQVYRGYVCGEAGFIISLNGLVFL